MTTFYAQPYDISANGFYFDSVEEYEVKAAQCRNDCGQPVEEFEIQFIDGEDLDYCLFDALSINQANINIFIEKLDEWENREKYNLILAVGECGYSFNMVKDNPSDFDIDIYEVDSLRELAEQFVIDGYLGEISNDLRHYLDYDALAGYLAFDFNEICIAGNRFIYRCD